MMATTPAWILFIGFATKAVLLILVFLSVWSVSVMLGRKKALQSLVSHSGEQEVEDLRKKIQTQDRAGMDAWIKSHPGLIAEVMSTVLGATQNAEAIGFAVNSKLADEKMKLSTGLNVLATLGSNAPFIGLFGTVLGIIQSFGALATSQSAMNDVIFSLAEALIATAIGLFVAIPATIAFNYFTQRIRNEVVRVESLRDLYLSKLVYGGK